MRRIIAFTVCLVLLFGLSACAIDKGINGDKKTDTKKPSEEKADLVDFYNLSDEVYLTVVDGKVSDSKDYSVRSDGQVYIPLNVARSLDSRFYYNKDEEQMIISTPSKLLYYWPNATNHREGTTTVPDTVAMFRAFGGRLYVSAELFLQYSDISTRVFEKPQRVVLFRNGVNFPSKEVSVDTVIRIGASIQKAIVAELKAGESVIVTGDSENGFYKVSTEDGQVGYVVEKDLGRDSTVMIHASSKNYARRTLPSEVHLMWHQMWAAQGAEDLRTSLKNTKGITVVSPTWFDFKDAQGAITTLANASYVEEAHRQGIQVWALCSDFAADVKGYDILSNTEARTNLEQNLINEVLRVGADGINLDFEFITADSGPHYIQFIRELYLLCREHNLVLTADNFVPNAGKAHYQLADQADVLDYVIFMAYDEHYKGSGAGSVASYPWVETAVNNALKIVPAEKIVLGIPLFNRIWMTDKEGKLTISDGGMSTVTEQAKKNSTPTWDDDLKQFYAEYTDKKSGTKYQFWIEDAKSLEYKLKLIPDKGLAGYAGWKLGLEAPDVWGLLEQY